MSDFAKFLRVNGLKRKDIASYLGVSGAFITQITSGDRPLPDDKLAKIKANAFGWDVSMLPHRRGLSLFSGVNLRTNHAPLVNVASAIQQTVKNEDKVLIGYLERKIEDKDRLIRELEKQIGMLEAKIELLGKGDITTESV
jgi:transcriptional regulator with XRE-family HTH domain